MRTIATLLSAALALSAVSAATAGTLDQVKAAKPTQDYDPLYGPSDAFVEAAYRSLAAAAIRTPV